MGKIISTFDWERKFLEEGFDFVIGTDEAGRGPLAGPVVACATIVRKTEIRNPKSETNSNDQNSNDQNIESPKAQPSEKVEPSCMWELVRDSKTLSAKQREKVFDFICENFFVGVGICDHKTIDEINILEASFLAMKKAISALTHNMERETQIESAGGACSKFCDMRKIILVDGNKKIPNLSLYQEAVIGGDKIVKSISAASIVAKVTRDRMMLEMHEKYPEYGFDKHKGYGTKLHMEALQKFGPCEIHRQSFEPMPTLAKKWKR